MWYSFQFPFFYSQRAPVNWIAVKKTPIKYILLCRNKQSSHPFPWTSTGCLQAEYLKGRFVLWCCIQTQSLHTCWVTSTPWEMWQVLKCVWQTSFICQITAPCISQPSIFCPWEGREWSASNMRARLESAIRARMHWHLLHSDVEMIFLRTPMTVYNHVFQENSQYSRCREQRLQAVCNRWANLPAFWGMFPLAWSRDSHPGARWGGTGGERDEWVAPALPLRPGHRWQNRTEVFLAGTAIIARLLPPTLLPCLLKLTKAGDTTAISLLRSWLQPPLRWHRVDVLLLVSFSAQGQAEREPQEMLHTSQQPLLFQLLSVSALEEKVPYYADNPSTQQAGSATITLTAFLKILSEPEFWLHWHLINHIKIFTYALFLFLFPPAILASDVTVLLTF